MPAGNYWERMTHYPRTVTPDAGTGFKKPTFAEGNVYWCWTEFKKPKTGPEYGIPNRTVEIVVHVRGYPEIDTLDRLYLNVAGVMCDIKGGLMYDYGLGETIIECTAIPTLEA